MAGLNDVSRMMVGEAEEAPPAPIDSPVMKHLRDTQSRSQEAMAALDARRNQLINLSMSRKNQMFNPQLLALASGLLAPTKTGSFSESLGYAARGLGEEQAKQQALDIQEAKMMYELEAEAMKQREALAAQGLLPAILGGKMARPAPGAVEAAVAPTGGKQPAAQPTAQTAPSQNLLDQLSDEELLAMSSVPATKQVAETVLKLRESQRKDKIKVKFGDQEREVPTAEYRSLENALENNDWATAKKWYQKHGLAWNFVEEKQADGSSIIRPMTSAEQEAAKTKATEAEKAKYGEQKEYTIPYAGGTRKFPMTPSQYIEYLDADSKGKGEDYINKLFKIKGEATPTTGGVPKTKAEEEVEVAGEKTRAESRVKAAEATREGLFESSRAARQLIQNSDQIIQLATDPKTKDIFGVFAKPGILNALGTLVSEGARVGNYTISLPSVEKAMRQAGASEEEIKAAAVAARIFAQNELGFRKMFLSGQGSVSNMEGAVIPRFSGDLSDSPGAAQAKAEMTKARAELDAAAARILREWERRPENAKKNFSDFEDSKEYNRLLDGYDAKLKKIMAVHFPGEKFETKPNAPAGSAPKKTQGQPNLDRTQPEGVDRSNKWLK